MSQQKVFAPLRPVKAFIPPLSQPVLIFVLRPSLMKRELEKQPGLRSLIPPSLQTYRRATHAHTLGKCPAAHKEKPCGAEIVAQTVMECQ